MIYKVLVSIFILLFISTTATAQFSQQIEIFDIGKGKVIATVQSSTNTQQEVKKILEGITGVYTKYNPIPNKGFMVRVPLEPTIMVRNLWFDDLVDEVTIIFPSQEKPYLMIFDDENKPYFLTFNRDTTRFLKIINFKPQTLFPFVESS